MSSPEVERFEVTEDDLAYAGFGMGYQRRRMSKQQAWTGFSSSDEDDENAFRGRSNARGRRGGRRGVDYSNPINFVSGGVKGGTAPDNDADASRPPDDPYTDEDEDAIEILPKKKQKPKEKPRARGNYGGRSGNDSMGGWERHTRGIGMKLLEQMGYEHGKGLGQNGRGIVTPVQATERRGKEAVGYYGKESAPAPRRGDEPLPASGSGGGTGQYKKQQHKSDSSGRPRYEYKTAAEIIAEGKTSRPFLRNSEMSRVKVIDMTGREQRVYSGYENALARQPDRPEEAAEQEIRLGDGGGQGRAYFDLPVLLHNLDLLVDRAEEGIVNTDRRRRNDEDRSAALEHELRRLDELCDSEASRLRRLEETVALLEQYHEELAAQRVGLSECAAWVERLVALCPSSAQLAPNLVVVLARPVLTRGLGSWRALEDPSGPLELLRRWRKLVGSEALYGTLLEEVWLPPVRRALQNEWCVREPMGAVALLEMWRAELPELLLERMVLGQLVYPRLLAAVEEWNPLTDPTPVHHWLHPWLPLMAAQMEPVHDAMRQKLGLCLAAWHPADGSAHAILLPWRDVFRPADMTAFLRRHVLPKLADALRSFQVNPANQDLTLWRAVMTWTDLVPSSHLAYLLVEHFFPRWLGVLAQWLNARPNYAEVGSWFSGWKGELPAAVHEFPGVKHAFQQAVQMMDRSLNGHVVQPCDSGASAAAGSAPAPGPSVTRALLPTPDRLHPFGNC